MTESGPSDPALARFLADELGAAPGEGAGPWTVTTPLWIWQGNGNGPPPKAAWYFLTIDGDAATAIRAASSGRTGGFGSVRVDAQIGRTRWTTSLFASRELHGYLLPIKADVRRREALMAGAAVTVVITLV